MKFVVRAREFMKEQVRNLHSLSHKKMEYALQFTNANPKYAKVRKDTFENSLTNQTAAVLTEQPICPQQGIFYFEIEYEVRHTVERPNQC
jgi:hypothetical protein